MEHVKDYKVTLNHKNKHAAFDIPTAPYCSKDMKNSYTFTLCLYKVTYFLWNQRRFLSIVRTHQEPQNEALKALQRTPCLKSGKAPQT